MAQREIALLARTAQVEIAIVQPRLLAGVDLVLDDEGRRLGGIQDAQLGGENFHFAAGELGIGLLPQGHAPANGDHVFRAQLLGAGMRRYAQLLIEDDLGDSAAVAHVDEDEVAKVAPPVHPAHEHDVFIGVGRAQIAGVMRAMPVSEQIERGHVRFALPADMRANRPPKAFSVRRRPGA